jgi:pimeloyl-ACP methyl ester carboxylesterase
MIMPTPTISEYLQFANLQMAAEAFLVRDDGTVRDDIAAALIAGNNHASRFTQNQADSFAEQWEVLDQKANTATGFSGTLFKAIKDNLELGIHKDDLVLSFRSTEFLDDAARDNEATNKLEIGDFGFAFGQLADMETWYAKLQGDPSLLKDKAFSVTGYSLGGHLATAFNLLHPGAAEQVVTFNGPDSPVLKHDGGKRMSAPLETPPETSTSTRSFWKRSALTIGAVILFHAFFDIPGFFYENRGWDIPSNPVEKAAYDYAHSLKLPDSVPQEAPYFPFWWARIVALIPGAPSVDEAYFRHLCEYEAGDYVFKRVGNVEGVFQLRPREAIYWECRSTMTATAWRSRRGWGPGIRIRGAGKPQESLVQPPIGVYEFLEQPSL